MRKIVLRKIRNPVTGTYYKLRVRNTKAGERGTILGRWFKDSKDIKE